MRRHSICSMPSLAPASSSSSSSSAEQQPDAAADPSLSQKAMIVAVRIRPLSGKELESGQRSCITVVNGETIAIKKADATASAGFLKSQLAAINEYGFDAAFDESATQTQVYEATAKPFIPNLLAGLNVTVFAYGATGSGKTHTMLGNTRADEASAHAEGGIIPLTIHDLFAQIDQRRAASAPGETWTVSVQFLEIYNEQVYDLLEPTGKVLQLREDQEKGTVVVAGVTEQPTATAKAVLDLLARGNGNRKTEATMANSVSSRSHAVLQLTLRRCRRNDAAREVAVESKLSLIDLAGSERASATNNRGARLQEGANINKSLLALGNCINSLASNAGAAKRTNVKYRDSRLTHLLKSSLEGGRCNLVMIANVNPSDLTYEDSHNTLKYANRAKNIKVDARSTAVAVESTWVEREARLREENARLRERVAELEALVSALRAGGLEGAAAMAMPLLEEQAEAEASIPEPEAEVEMETEGGVDASVADAASFLEQSLDAAVPESDCVLEEMDADAEEGPSLLSSQSKKRPREEGEVEAGAGYTDLLSDSVLLAGLEGLDGDAEVLPQSAASEVDAEAVMQAPVLEAAPNKKRRGSLLPQPKTRAAAPEAAPALAPTQPTTLVPSDRRTRRNTISVPRITPQQQQQQEQQDENANPQMLPVVAMSTEAPVKAAPLPLRAAAASGQGRRKSLAAVHALLDALPDTDTAEAGPRAATRSAVAAAKTQPQRGLSTRRKSSVGVSAADADGWTPSQVYLDI